MQFPLLAAAVLAAGADALLAPEFASPIAPRALVTGYSNSTQGNATATQTSYIKQTVTAYVTYCPKPT